MAYRVSVETEPTNDVRIILDRHSAAMLSKTLAGTKATNAAEQAVINDLGWNLELLIERTGGTTVPGGALRDAVQS